jgi:superfamily II DNA or RNA helicase
LFLTTPIKFSGRVLQYIGRVLRPAPGKKQARVYDYVDVKVDVLKAAAKARQKVYTPESHFSNDGGESAQLETGFNSH